VAASSKQQAQPKADPPLAEAGRLQQAVSKEQGAKRKRKGLRRDARYTRSAKRIAFKSL